MSIPLFFAPVKYVRELFLSAPLTLMELCQQAGITCKASGAWTDRRIELIRNDKLEVFAEPGDWGSVRIKTPDCDEQQQARLALAILAYGMHDLVAKQGVVGCKWLRLGPPRGRPRKRRALSVKERQRRFRESHGYSAA